MSMKYYAVTDDPNELLHYGRLGMKWGKHIFGDKPKSSGYKRALGKLRNSAKSKVGKARSALKSSSAQFAMNRQKKQQAKYNAAVKKAQQRANVVENLVSVDRDRKLYREANREIKRQQKAAKSMAKIERYQRDAAVGSLASQARQARRAVKVDKNFDRVLQKARKGKLKFGNLSEDQIARMQERLSSEANARKLGAAEKTWHQQKKEARRAGKLKGIEAGTAAAMTEIARAGAQFGVQHVIDRMKLRSAAKQEGTRQRIKNRAQNKKTHRDINREIRDEAYEERVRSGEGIIKRNNPFYLYEDNTSPIGVGVGFKPKFTTKSAANYMKIANKEKEAKEEQKRLQNDANQLSNQIYRTLMTTNPRFKDTGNIDRETMENERDNIRRLVYGEVGLTKFDPPVAKTPEPKRSRVTGKPITGTTISKLSERIEKNQETYGKKKKEKPQITINGIPDLLGYPFGLPNNYSITNALTLTKRRKKKDNPLKG